MMDIPSKRFQGEQGSYSASSIISRTAGEQSIAHNLENNIAVLRELAHPISFMWEMLCAYMRRRSQDSCGDLERFNAYFLGPDGEVRSGVVKVKYGNLPSSEWRHPLLRVYPLEVKLNTEPDNTVPITVVRDEDVPAVVVNSS